MPPRLGRCPAAAHPGAGAAPAPAGALPPVLPDCLRPCPAGLQVPQQDREGLGAAFMCTSALYFVATLPSREPARGGVGGRLHCRRTPCTCAAAPAWACGPAVGAVRCVSCLHSCAAANAVVQAIMPLMVADTPAPAWPAPAVLDPAEVVRLRGYKHTPVDMFEREGGAFYPGRHLAAPSCMCRCPRCSRALASACWLGP